MTVAVFAYFSGLEKMMNDALWINRLMEAALNVGAIKKFVVFTNQPGIVETGLPGIEIPEQKSAPRLVLVRQRYLRAWKKSAEEKKVNAVLCFGLDSLIATALPTYIFLEATKPAPVAKLQRLKGVQGIFCDMEGQKAKVDKVAPVKAQVVPGGPFLQIAPEGLSEDTRDRFTQGCAYFLYAGPVANTAAFITLLKAFSRFKRRQKSSFKLVLLPSLTNGLEALQQALATYKYRDEVVFPEMPLANSDMAALYASAYLFVQPVVAAAYGAGLKEALVAGLPVIALQDAATSEWVQDAALYFDAGDDETLATHLMQVYKDEALQGSLSAKAKATAVKYSWAESARRVGEVLAHSVK